MIIMGKGVMPDESTYPKTIHCLLGDLGGPVETITTYSSEERRAVLENLPPVLLGKDAPVQVEPGWTLIQNVLIAPDEKRRWYSQEYVAYLETLLIKTHLEKEAAGLIAAPSEWTVLENQIQELTVAIKEWQGVPNALCVELWREKSVELQLLQDKLTPPKAIATQIAPIAP